jgi:hypothetical protein
MLLDHARAKVQLGEPLRQELRHRVATNLSNTTKTKAIRQHMS